MDKQNLIEMIRAAARLTENSDDRDVTGQQLTEASAAADNAGMTDIGNLLMDASDRLYEKDVNLQELAGEINGLANKARDNIVSELEAAIRAVLDSSTSEAEAILNGLSDAINSLKRIQALDLAEKLSRLLNMNDLKRDYVLTTMARVRSDLTGIPLVQVELDEEDLEELGPEDMEELPAYRKMRGADTHDDEWDIGRPIFTGEAELPDTLDNDVPYDLDDDSDIIVPKHGLDVGSRKKAPLNVGPVPDLPDDMDAPFPANSTQAPSEVQTVEVPPVREQSPEGQVKVFRGKTRIALVRPSQLGGLISGGAIEPNDEIEHEDGRRICVREIPRLMAFLPEKYQKDEKDITDDDDFFLDGTESPEEEAVIRQIMSNDPPALPEQTVKYRPLFLWTSAILVVLFIGAGFTYQFIQYSDPQVETSMVEVETRWAVDRIAKARAKADDDLFEERKEKLRVAILAWEAQKEEKK